MRLGLRESFFEYFKGPGITISLKLIENITFKLNFNLKKKVIAMKITTLVKGVILMKMVSI